MCDNRLGQCRLNPVPYDLYNNSNFKESATIDLISRFLTGFHNNNKYFTGTLSMYCIKRVEFSSDVALTSLGLILVTGL